MPAWDTRVIYVERRGRWWWNAWRASTSTELHGFADTEDEADREMRRAIEQAGEAGTTEAPHGRYP